MSSNPSYGQQLRKTRIVCISDTHSASPADGAFKLPKGDVLIHAGDLTNQGSFSEVRKTVEWIEKADFEVKIIVAGNHDLSLDKSFYETYGALMHKPPRSELHACRNLLQSSTSITYLEHSAATIRLQSDTGPHTTFRVFGSPYIPACGKWAFQYTDDDEAAKLWNDIPLDTDIVITHTPPYNHCDASPKWGAAGCKELRKALWRVRPRLAVCGHVHEARGAETVRWKLGLPHVSFAEDRVEQWRDPGMGNKKTSLLDLTGRSGRALRNDGSVVRKGWSNHVEFSLDGGRDLQDQQKHHPDDSDSSRSTTSDSTTYASTMTSFDPEKPQKAYSFSPSQTPNRRLSRLHQDNVQPVSGRGGRQETCIVNAAIMARSFGNGPKRYNKPIVIDMDLPIWRSTESDEPIPVPRASLSRHPSLLAYQPPLEDLPPWTTSATSTTTTATTTTYSSYDTEEDSDATASSMTSADTIHNMFYSR